MPTIASRPPLLIIGAACLYSFSCTVPAATTNTLMLEEVIVTATRRAETANRVPIAISAFTAEQLRADSVFEVKDIAQISPSLAIASGTSESGNTEIRIRGIGTNGTNPGLESSVGVFIDGVYRSRPGLAMGTLLDIGRVEILRGPQGTLFGRNTSAGALSLHSKMPERKWAGYLEAGVENLDGYKIEGGITGPLVQEQLSFRLAGVHHERDGYIGNRAGPQEFYDRDRTSIKAQLLWEPKDTIAIRLIGDYANKDEQCCAADYVVAGPTAPVIESLGGIVKVNPFDYKAQTNFGSRDSNEERGLSAQVDWELSNDLVLTYIGAWRDNEINSNIDPDTSNADLLQGTNNESDFELQTHELRLAGQSGRLDWVVGGYYYEEEIDVSWSVTFGSQFGEYMSTLQFGFPVPPVVALFPEGAGDEARIFSQQGDGYALFTHNVIELTESLELVIGARWSEDHKDASAEVINTSIHCGLIPGLLCPVDPFDESFSHGEPSGTLKLVYNTDNLVVFGGYSRGYKAGGFNLDRDATRTATQFEPEIVDNYELGAKWSGMDNRLQLNSAVFYSEISDFQINEFDGLSFTITNAGEVESKGVELELSYLATENLTVNLGVTRVDNEYIKHPGFNNQEESLVGMQVTRSPDWSGTVSIAYNKAINSLMFSANLNAAYTDSQFIGAINDAETTEGAYTIVNAQLGLASIDGPWGLILWSRNLLDEEYNVAKFPSVFQEGSYSSFRGEPRTYGITARYDF